jgi:hypothetical protein
MTALVHNGDAFAKSVKSRAFAPCSELVMKKGIILVMMVLRPLTLKSKQVRFSYLRTTAKNGLNAI